MSTPPQVSNLRVDIQRQGDSATLRLSGRLDATTLPSAWDAADTLGPTRHLRIDVAPLDYCDGAGLGLFTELRRRVCLAGGELEISGASPPLRRLLDTATLKDPTLPELRPATPLDLIVQIGKAVWVFVQDMTQIISFVGEMVATLAWAARHPAQVRFKDVLDIAEKAGVNALPVVSLLGLLVGVILAYQTAVPLARYGAQPLIPTIVAIAIIREMGPLITAIILAGRSGSAFAAEIGTMKVTEELDALKTMGLTPLRFLVVPRVLAGVAVTPVLTIINMALGLIGGYLVMSSLGYSLSFYVDSVKLAVTYVDLLGGLFKSFIFGIVVCGIGCLRGMQTQSGPGAVGDSTTRAVVAGIVLTIFCDAILGILYNALNI